MKFRLVILESPYAGATAKEVQANVEYARQCVAACLARGESALASHLLFTQQGITNDDIPHERTLGIEAGLAWHRGSDACVVYTDRGISPGMRHGINVAAKAGKRIEFRSLYDPNKTHSSQAHLPATRRLMLATIAAIALASIELIYSAL